MFERDPGQSENEPHEQGGMEKCKFGGVAQLFGQQIHKYCQYDNRKGKQKDFFNIGYLVFQDKPGRKTGKGDCGEIAEPVVLHCHAAENEMCFCQ